MAVNNKHKWKVLHLCNKIIYTMTETVTRIDKLLLQYIEDTNWIKMACQTKACWD